VKSTEAASYRFVANPVRFAAPCGGESSLSSLQSAYALLPQPLSALPSLPMQSIKHFAMQ